VSGFRCREVVQFEPSGSSGVSEPSGSLAQHLLTPLSPLDRVGLEWGWRACVSSKFQVMLCCRPWDPILRITALILQRSFPRLLSLLVAQSWYLGWLGGSCSEQFWRTLPSLVCNISRFSVTGLLSRAPNLSSGFTE
jgi:hypothetical protein